MTASAPDLLVLHAVRLLGFADTDAVAARFGLDADETGELLEDHRARGLVTWSSFGGTGGWSLTERGRLEGERLLAAELDATGRRDVVRRSHLDFVDLNAQVLQAVTDWQTRPTPGNALADNDHQDLRWDTRVLARLSVVEDRLRPLGADLGGVLPRLDGYAARYSAALARARAGERHWVDAIGIDSCHTVWFQLHEDLLATLGLSRRA